MVSHDEKIGVTRWVDHILVSLPLHLKTYFNSQKSLQLRGELLNSGQERCRRKHFYERQKKAGRQIWTSLYLLSIMGLWTFCFQLQKPKVMLFLPWHILRMSCLFSCSHLTLCCLKRNNGTAALLLVFLQHPKPHIIGLSSSCALSPFSPDVTSALMYFSVERQLKPCFPFLCKLSLHCGAVIGLSADSGLCAV